MRSNYDMLTTLLLPLAREMEPGDALALNDAARRALTRDGFVEPDAIPVMTSFITDGVFDDATNTNASTSVWKKSETLTLLPGEGTWAVKALAQFRCSHSADPGNVDFRLVIGGIAQSPQPTPRPAPASVAVPFQTLFKRTGVPGSQSIDVWLEFRASTVGTVTISEVVLDADAWRTS